jgi:hypothetical protein
MHIVINVLLITGLLVWMVAPVLLIIFVWRKT